VQIKWICPTAPTRPVTILGGFSCTACNIKQTPLLLLFILIESAPCYCKLTLVVEYYSSGFDMGELSEDGPDDSEGLDASAAHIANLLSTEPADGNF